MRNTKRQGSVVLEFTLVGIPMIFVLISTFEIARGMWIYDTMGNSVREGARFAIVRGNNCAKTPNTCASTVRGIAERIRLLGVGLDPNVFTVRLSSSSRTIGPAPLATLLRDNSYFPSAGPGNLVEVGGMSGQPITISGTYPFAAAIAMFWPGAGSVTPFPTHHLNSTSSMRIQF